MKTRSIKWKNYISYIIVGIIAIVFSIIYFSLMRFAPMFVLSQIGIIIITLIQITIMINVGLGVFNLIPLPPLDGSKILMHFLPYKGKEWFYRNQQIFYIVFLILFVTGLSSVILTPIFSGVLTGMEWLVYNIFKLLTLI